MLAVLVSDCFLCGPAMWVPGSEVRAHAAQPGRLGPWGPGPWTVPRVGLSKGPSGKRESAGTLRLRCLLLSRPSHRRLHRPSRKVLLTMTGGCPRVVEALRFIWIRIKLERLAMRDGRLCE